MSLIAGPTKEFPFSIHYRDHLHGCPAVPLLLTSYAELIENNFATASIILKNKSLMLWAQDQDTVVGGVCYEYYPDYLTGYVTMIFVHPDYRRQGIATKLWLSVEYDIKRLGGIQINSTVHENNTNMIEFTRRMGNTPSYVKMIKDLK